MRPIRALGFLVFSIGIATAQTDSDSIHSVFNSPLASQPVRASSAPISYVVAHFPYGGGWNTRVMLANTGASDATVDVNFFQPGGAPALVPLEGQTGLQGSQHLVIPKNHVQVVGGELSRRNDNATTVAWATAVSNAPLNVFSLFDIGPSVNSINAAVGAQSTPAAKTFRFPISVYGPTNYTAGLAVANPNKSGTNVTVKLLDATGAVKATIQKNLPADGQTIFLVTDKTAFFNEIDPSKLFNGSLAICASQPVGLVAIGAEGGALFTTSVTNDPCP
ncbi:MAG TPA: hypothetical protein VJN43_09765 [Bryobacteraceae bacterium]|nr:hypothetical protein [Bryobacteraceae bacterium]